MHFHFLGTGSAFTLQNKQTNFFIRAGGKRLLVDCGSDIRQSLAELGYTYRDLDAVYISHQHADHIGGLEWLAFLTFFDPSCSPLPLYIAQDIDLWNDHLKESLKYLVGRVAQRSEFFNWQEMVIPATIDVDATPDVFQLGHLTFELVPLWHVVGEIKEPGYGMRSFGLRISGPEEPNVFWTSDTIYDPASLREHYEWAEYILHDCETTMTGETLVNSYAVKSRVHPHFYDLVNLPPEIKSKMFLLHYQDNILGPPGCIKPRWRLEAKKNGFHGFIEPKAELILR